MSPLLSLVLLVISILLRVNGGTHQFQTDDIIYVNGHSTDDIKTGPKSAKHQINSQHFAQFNNNNQDNYYQNPHLANNQNARYIVQSNGAPTIQTIYESSSISPVVGYHQTNSDSSSQHNSSNSHQSDSTKSSNQTQFIQPQTVFINSNQGYLLNQNQNPHEVSHGSVGNNFVVNQNVPTIIETSTPGYQTTASSSNSDSFESSSKSSSSSSSKSSSQFNSQATTANPFYQPQIIQVTTPHSVRYDNNQQGIIAGSSKYLPPMQTSYQSSSPVTTSQSFESSSQSSSDSQSHSESSSQSNQKTTFVTTMVGPDIPQSHSISMSVTPTPYIVSVSTPQTYEISHPPVPITPIAPVHPHVPAQPIPTPQTYEISHPPVPITPKAPVQHVPTPQTYAISHPPVPISPIQPVHTSVPVPVLKPMIQPAPFAVPIGHYYNPNSPQITQYVPFHPDISVLKPAIQPAPFIPTTPHIHHGSPIQPTIHHVPAVTEIPVTEDQDHRGVVEKTVNIPQPDIKTQTYEIRRPAIQKQFYDIEERVIVRPAGSVVVEIDQPLSKTAKGDEVIIQNGGGAGISESHSNGAVYTQGTSHGHNGGNVNTEKQDGISEGHNGYVYTQGINQDHNNNEAVNTGNHGGHHQFITSGGNNYQHVVGGFGYYSIPNICNQYSQQFSAAPFVNIHHPSIGYSDQQFQPSNHGVTSTTSNPVHSTTTAPFNNNDHDSVVINARYQQQEPSGKYIDSITQSNQISSITTEGPNSNNNKQQETLQPSQQPIPTRNTNIRQMPHMIAVGDPDFQSPPYVEILPNGEAANKMNTNNVQKQQQPTIRGDLHNTGANTLYTMQSVMNDEYLNEQQNQQPQVNFNQEQQLVPNQQIPNNSSPYIVYAISARNPNNYVPAPQQRQIVFPQQNSAIQQIPQQYNPAYSQQIIQPQHYNNQHFTPQRSADYTTSGNHQIISHSPIAYSSSYYNQRIPNTPINVHLSQYTQDPRLYHHYTKNIPNSGTQEQYKNPHLNTGPSIFPQQEYEKHSASYTQPQNFQQQYPSQQVNYAQNAALTQAPQNNIDNFEQQFPAQQVFSYQNNQPSQILGNQGQELQEQNQQNFIPQTNNTQSNSQLSQESPVQISFNESDSYPIINIRNNINNTNVNEQQFPASVQPSQIVPDNNTKFNGNFNETNNQGYNNNLSNTRFRGDIQQQEDSQPQSSSISRQYENDPNVNINYQPNENQKKLLNLILTHQGSSGNNNNDNYQDLTSNSHVISATPAPKNSEPAGERVHTRRIVVNQPLETIQVVKEQIPITNYEQVQQPTSKVGLKRFESSVPIFVQPQHLPGYETIQYNNHHQPISYNFVHRQ